MDETGGADCYVSAAAEQGERDLQRRMATRGLDAIAELSRLDASGRALAGAPTRADDSGFQAALLDMRDADGDGGISVREIFASRGCRPWPGASTTPATPRRCSARSTGWRS